MIPTPNARNLHSILYQADENAVFVTSAHNDTLFRYRLDPSGTKVVETEAVYCADPQRRGQDRYHLNSVTEWNGDFYLTMFGTTDGPTNRDRRNGRVVRVSDGETVVEGLYHPHSVFRLRRRSARRRVAGAGGAANRGRADHLLERFRAAIRGASSRRIRPTSGSGSARSGARAAASAPRTSSSRPRRSTFAPASSRSTSRPVHSVARSISPISAPRSSTSAHFPPALASARAPRAACRSGSKHSRPRTAHCGPPAEPPVPTPTGPRANGWCG